MPRREACPGCGLLYEHVIDCPMYGMSEMVSSLLFGYPVCQCCGLVAGERREEVHAAKQNWRDYPPAATA